VTTVLALAIPVAVYLAGIYALYAGLFEHVDAFHALLLVLTAIVVAAGPILAAAGVSMAVCLLVVMMAPAVSVIGYEVHGHRRVAEALQRTLRP
ncbi:MAG: low temperature requirement protein A, partial [Gemmatimonadetes bacterium]|nr:low temperature requirement protein A [Gemmatimonadota bacterium]